MRPQFSCKSLMLMCLFAFFGGYSIEVFGSTEIISVIKPLTTSSEQVNDLESLEFYDTSKPIPKPPVRSNTPPPKKEYTPSDWIVLNVGGGIQYNQGGWSGRYSNHLAAALGAEYQKKEKFLVGFHYMPYHGSSVNADSMFGGIQGPSGYVLDQFGFSTIVRAYLRGFNIAATVGKIQPIKTTPLAVHSIIYTGGLGYHEHFTQFQLDKGKTPQLEGIYADGYDNYRRGIAITESVRYQYLNNDAISVFIGIHCMQSLTTPARSWDFGLNRAPDPTQVDFSIGTQFGIIIPINVDSKAKVQNSKSDYFFD